MDISNTIISIITKLKNQSKRADIDSIYNQLKKNPDISKEHISKTINELLNDQKIINKVNRNKDSFYVNKEVVLSSQDTLMKNTPAVSHVSTPTYREKTPHRNSNLTLQPCNLSNGSLLSTSIAPDPIFTIDTPTTTQTHYNSDITENEALIDDMFKKIKMEEFKNDIIKSLQKDIENNFASQLSTFKSKCETLVSKSYANNRAYIERLETEIKQKDELIKRLLISIENITSSSNMDISSNASITETYLGTLISQHPEESPITVNQDSNIVENSVNNDSIDSKSTTEVRNKTSESINNQLNDIRKKKHENYLVYKSENDINENDEAVEVPSNDTKGNHVWPAGTCLIVGDSILTGIDERKLSNPNQLVKVRDFRGASIDDLKHHLVPLLKKEPEHIILHVGTNDSTSKTSREILDELLQLKQHIKNLLPNSKVIISKPTLRTDNGKATLTLNKLNSHLEQLDIDIVDNSNIKGLHLGKKGLHLNKKGKQRLELNFLGKLRNL